MKVTTQPIFSQRADGFRITFKIIYFIFTAIGVVLHKRGSIYGYSYELEKIRNADALARFITIAL